MGSLSKKVPYPHDNVLLSACKFMASSRCNGKFSEFVRFRGADSLPEIAKVLPADTLFHLFAKVAFKKLSYERNSYNLVVLYVLNYTYHGVAIIFDSKIFVLPIRQIFPLCGSHEIYWSINFNPVRKSCSGAYQQ